jgi:hypothetical protein
MFVRIGYLGWLVSMFRVAHVFPFHVFGAPVRNRLASSAPAFTTIKTSAV